MFSRCVKSTSRSIQRVLALASRAPKAYSFSSAQGSGDGPKLNLNLKGIKKELSKPVYFDETVNKKHYDVAIIGGGSAGLGFVLEAQKIGLNVVMFDFVDPSPRGTKWGLGGTCVNVGCIPKKLMHHAANTKEMIVDSYDYGFNLGEFNDPDDHTYAKLHESLEWSRLVRNVQMNVKRTNFTYIADVKEYDNTTYVNGMAAFHDKNTLVYTNQKSALEDYLKTDKIDTEKMGTVTVDHIIVAVGGRPTYLNEKVCKGVHEHAITSDDIFSLKNPPNKTLVVGGGYIALECAGFLSTLGYPVTLMNRTDVFLRGFDQDMATTVIDFMKRNSEINVLPWTLPSEITKENGKLVTKFKNLQDSTEGRDEFDTILLAIGRTPNTTNLNLKKVGVEVNPKSHKIVGGYHGEFEKTSVNNIYALGDVLDKIPELTPVASKSAHNLARRLQYAKDGKAGTPEYKRYLMDYRDFPTAVFTPLEYACVGFSEEKAIEVYGEENIQVYHTKFTPLDQTLLMRNHPVDGESMKMKGYAKVVCNKKEDERVVGLHYAGPNAGEVIQGYAVAVKLGMTKHDLERTVAIHPTTSEEIVLMEKTKAEDPEKTSCCA